MKWFFVSVLLTHKALGGGSKGLSELSTKNRTFLRLPLPDWLEDLVHGVESGEEGGVVHEQGRLQRHQTTARDDVQVVQAVDRTCIMIMMVTVDIKWGTRYSNFNGQLAGHRYMYLHSWTWIYPFQVYILQVCWCREGNISSLS